MISPEPVPAPLAPLAPIVTTDGRIRCATCVTWQEAVVDPVLADWGTPVAVVDAAPEDDEGELIAFAITPPTTPPTTAQPAQAINSQDPGRLPLPLLPDVFVDVTGTPRWSLNTDGIHLVSNRTLIEWTTPSHRCPRSCSTWTGR